MLRIPNKIHVFGQKIDVSLTSTPEEIPGKGVILGRYTPKDQTIVLYNNPSKPEVAASNFIHETIEAIDCLGDLQMNHTQISTLSSALHQVFGDLLPSYELAEAC